MGLFRNIRSMFHDDWCSKCKSQMDVANKQLYALPTMRVGHYQEHDDPAYYKKNLVPYMASMCTAVPSAGIMPSS